jgi:hypothetical protein
MTLGLAVKLTPKIVEITPAEESQELDDLLLLQPCSGSCGK